MKKVYDWNIRLRIHAMPSNRQLSIVCSVHTNIHQLKIQILKQLSLPLFDTELDIYSNGQNSHRPLKPTSTLQQNQIVRDSMLSAQVKRQKVNQKLDVNVEADHDRKHAKKNSQEIVGTGLTLKACCTNPSCLNYQQDIIINKGYGSFPFYLMISDLKCQLCPYKSQYLCPNMMCKGVQVSTCLFEIRGTSTDSQGIPSDKSMGYIKVKGTKNILGKVVDEKWDKNIILTVKHL